MKLGMMGASGKLKTMERSICFWAVCFVILTVPALGQTAGANEIVPLHVLQTRPGLQTPAAGEVLREIDDPHTGDRWLLVRDDSNPGGPGRLVPAPAGFSGPNARDSAVPTSRPALSPVIRGGDRLILEETTPTVEARLEAVALGPARLGAPLKVRLKLGGQVVDAVALGSGRVAFASGKGKRP